MVLPFCNVPSNPAHVVRKAKLRIKVEPTIHMWRAVYHILPPPRKAALSFFAIRGPPGGRASGRRAKARRPPPPTCGWHALSPARASCEFSEPNTGATAQTTAASAASVECLFLILSPFLLPLDAHAVDDRARVDGRYANRLRAWWDWQAYFCKVVLREDKPLRDGLGDVAVG